MIDFVIVIALAVAGLVLLARGAMLSNAPGAVMNPRAGAGLQFFVGSLLLMLAILGACISVANAADRPRLSQNGCRIAADMVLVARSLSAAGIEREKASEVMALVYAAIPDDGTIAKLREDLADFAYGRTERPVDVGNAFGSLCMERGGVLDGVLGTRMRWRF